MARLGPILISTCPALGWKVENSKSPVENLRSLVHKLSLSIEKIITGRLSGEQEIEERRKLAQALNDTGMSLAAIPLMQTELDTKTCSTLSQEIEEKNNADLLATLLSLHTNSPKLRKDSLQYEEAAPEIQTAYFVKLSLYQIELHRRKIKSGSNVTKKIIKRSPLPN